MGFLKSATETSPELMEAQQLRQDADFVNDFFRMVESYSDEEIIEVDFNDEFLVKLLKIAVRRNVDSYRSEYWKLAVFQNGLLGDDIIESEIEGITLTDEQRRRGEKLNSLLNTVDASIWSTILEKIAAENKDINVGSENLVTYN